MRTSLKLKLEQAIDKWMQDNCDDDDWPDMYVYGDLYVDMATAAEQVFDSSHKGQKFADNEQNSLS